MNSNHLLRACNIFVLELWVFNQKCNFTPFESGLLYHFVHNKLRRRTTRWWVHPSLFLHPALRGFRPKTFSSAEPWKPLEMNLPCVPFRRFTLSESFGINGRNSWLKPCYFSVWAVWGTSMQRHRSWGNPGLDLSGWKKRDLGSPWCHATSCEIYKGDEWKNLILQRRSRWTSREYTNVAGVVHHRFQSEQLPSSFTSVTHHTVWDINKTLSEFYKGAYDDTCSSHIMEWRPSSPRDDVLLA